MPDGCFAPLGDYRSRERAALWRGEQETRAELIEAGKERYVAALDEALDACEEIEREKPGAMRHARLLLADARSEVGGTE